MSGARGTVRERLLSRLIIDPSGCLLWTGRIDYKGYGQISVGGRKLRVHRLAWELENGPISAGLDLDHVKARGCRYRHCANIAHLEPVTRRENLLRGDTIAARNAGKDRCPQDHEYDLINTYWAPDGRRNCRICVRLAGRQYEARRRAARTAAP